MIFMEDVPVIKRALLSVFDKAGIVDFARQLVEEFHIELLSTGGTAKTLEKAGIPFMQVSDYTQSPEMFDGRVKTLHPRIHGGLLIRRDNPQDVQDATKYNVQPIDMVVVNLYPFSQVIAKAETTFDEALEMIDIGGPTMIRAAAKAHPYVTVICNPGKYDIVLQEMRANKGGVTRKTRMSLAQEVYATMALYDATVANYLGRQFEANYGITSSESGESGIANKNIAAKFPELLVKLYRKVQKCRYGENWEQAAAYYQDLAAKAGIQNCVQLHGKEISFNNFLDIDACLQILLDFGTDHYVTAILKHTNPNGVAIDFKSQLESCKHAFATDPLSAFGGIWGFNKPLTKEVADYIFNEKKVFVEVILAPEFTPDALAILKTKQNLRVVKFGNLLELHDSVYELPEIRGVIGGALVQEFDSGPVIKKWDVKTKRPVSESEKTALIFAYRVCKWAKSNSAVFAKEYDTGVYTLGIGAGQQSRVHVVKLAAQKGKEFGHDLKDSVMGTDSFFPFPDGLEASVEAGAKAIVNPGGSVKDADVIQKADELGVSLVFCDKRVFKH
jgi:phosphoribosylaminoimidazolecarboxamide formyltransferase/IMP cyclohydrolase